MTQQQLDHEVANQTGEELSVIHQRGFSIADPIDVSFDPEPAHPPKVMDWDQHEQDRNIALYGRIV